jgi:DNA-directed RNA polymerase subunit RPC12/RpoP
MPIEFDCPSCGAEIEAPDSSAGRRGECPECGAKIDIPKTSQLRSTRKSARPERKSGREGRPRPDEDVEVPRSRVESGRPPSKRYSAIEHYDDDSGDDYYEPEERRSRGHTRVKVGKPNYMVLGGIGIAVTALVIVLVVLMQDKGGNPQPTESASVSAQSTPPPTNTPPPIDLDAFMDALLNVAQSNALAVEAVIEGASEDLFSGGKLSIQFLISQGIASPSDAVRYRADMFASALTGAESQQDLLYSDNPEDISTGQKAWNDWWEANKGRSLYELLQGGLGGNSTGRFYLALALGVMKDKEAVPLLFNLLEDKETSVRTKAFRSVKKLLKNEAFNYNPESGLGMIAETVKRYRDWWDSVKDSYDFSTPEKHLPAR